MAAFVWPSCHDEPRVREYLWPEGVGEWEVINKGNPRYEGHYQPKKPLWGNEMDNDPKVVEKWIDVATNHGINIFIYDWTGMTENPSSRAPSTTVSCKSQFRHRPRRSAADGDD